MSACRPRVLLVDDEPHVLDALRDSLGRAFEVVTAVGGREALGRLDKDQPYAVIVSDLRMPELNGAAVLNVARRRVPDTTRILLTGYADLDNAIEAVNTGHIFRFLTKPCPKETLLKALIAGVAQHRLVTSQKVLLEQTLRGAVEALADTLALANPIAFGRATRLRDRASRLARGAGIENVWEIDIAATLSQIGCLFLPPETAERYYYGRPLGAREQELVDDIPRASARVIADIPRLDGVCAILEQQRLVGRSSKVTPAAHALRIAHDADLLEAQGLGPDEIGPTLRGRGLYDETLLALFIAAADSDGERVLLELTLDDVRAGMTFARDVTSPTGVLLVPRGHTVTPPLLERIARLPSATRRLPAMVIATPEAAQAAA